MEEAYSRTALLLTEEGVARLRGARVAVFGLGGVGGSAAEALCRAGVGTLDLIDNDVFSLSNLNRQVLALRSTVGQQKTQVAVRRFADIDPTVTVHTYDTFFLPETADVFDFSRYDYVIDAIDTVSGKIELALRCKAAGTPLIACMGTGNKLDPTRLRVSDLFETSVCPLARVMRQELKKRGVTSLTVVWSDETPLSVAAPSDLPGKRTVPGSVSFVPPVAGMIAAGVVVRALAGNR